MFTGIAYLSLFVQGDFHDVLRLRKKLMKAVLGHLNQLVCVNN